jgi:hypothetical protein
MPLEPAIKCAVVAVAGAVVVAASLVAIPGMVMAQPEGHAELMDFTAALENFPPPNDNRAKTLLEGERAEPLSNGWFRLTGVKLKMFNTNGAVDMVAETPQCYFDSVARAVNSSGPLLIRKTDGTFDLSGEGFLLQQTNFDLIISNRVHTIIRKAPGQMLRP